MVSFGASLVSPAIDVLTLAITGISSYFVFRQSTSLYGEVKGLLTFVHVFFGGVLILELVRNLYSALAFMSAYTLLGISFVLWDVILLTTIGAAVYLKPEGKGMLMLIRGIVKRKPVGLVYSAIVAYILFVNAYLFVATPYSIVVVTNITGTTLFATSFDLTFLALILGVLILFLAYTTSLFLLARAETRDRNVKRSLLALPIVWFSIGLELVVFNGYLVSRGVDYIPVGYMFSSVAFGVTAWIFRRASLLSRFFGHAALVQISVPTFRYSESIGIKPNTMSGRNFLFEIDPTANYETVIDDFAVEVLSNNGFVFVVTSKRSPIYNSLSKIKGVRFYLLTSSVSYPRESEIPNEILVPQNDQAILLDLIAKTIASDPESKLALIYDNISDMILSSSLESSYKFLKHVNELTDPRRIVTLFLFTATAHDGKTVDLIKTLFSNHVLMTSSGPILVKE